ncbi:MAG TPA: hypothetical protein VMA34_15040 [Terracidiphilus sp.]|nr:hypothetical protein [Terracidiphilus sp.]
MPLTFSNAIKRVSEHYDAEVCLYIGPIDRPHDDNFIARCKAFLSAQSHQPRPNFLLLLTTFGGDPHAAYRMARFVQDKFQTVPAEDVYSSGVRQDGPKFYVYIDTFCKSAGTIVALGADTLIMSDYGELGPIDVQLRKTDEVGERSSGLTPMDALSALNDLATEHFSDLFKHLRGGKDRELVFSTKMASEIAAKITVGLFGNIYSQIDPMRLGEYDRATRIALEYGNRLSHNNLHPGKLKHLLSDYPAHAFVIDRKEAKDIFASVEEPITELAEFGERARSIWNERHLNADEPLIIYLTTEEFLRDADPDPPENRDALDNANTEPNPTEDNHEQPGHE